MQQNSLPDRKVNVVLFSGGRGSRVLSNGLIKNSNVHLTIAINGYDDGASTGEVRRFLGDCLGPSDFRKNASRMSTALQTCSSGLIELLDLRFPDPFSHEEAEKIFNMIRGVPEKVSEAFQEKVQVLLSSIDSPSQARVGDAVVAFQKEQERSPISFSFSDCSIGNLVFAGLYLQSSRNFNEANRAYCHLLGLPEGLIENVTDGTNAYLVAVDKYHHILKSEADIVDASKRNYIQEIFLVREAPTEDEQRALTDATWPVLQQYFENKTQSLPLNQKLLTRIEEADLIIYAPGTQHSSLLPSYMTPGLGEAIAKNLRAIKVLVTNIQEDAEIPESSAVDIISKAEYYLKEKGRKAIPTPCLITHYLVNDNSRSEVEEAYVPLGRLQNLEDPRLVRIGNFEEGVSGIHDAQKILGPFIESFTTSKTAVRVAILLLETESLSKVTQTILEALRSGLEDVNADVSFFYRSKESWDMSFSNELPCSVHNVYDANEENEPDFVSAVSGKGFDYVVLFESSGMYRGDEIVNLLSLLQFEQLDAVWGSRRLSIRDIRESYKLRYKHTPLIGMLSYVGSHLLSFFYLVLYGRYITDTLSGVRAIRSTFFERDDINIADKRLNHYLLSLILGVHGDIFETPVQFFPLSPDKVKRTSGWEGIQSLFTILWLRVKPRPRESLLTIKNSSHRDSSARL